MLIPTSLSRTRSAHSSLRETVRLSEAHLSDLSIVRKAHLENALVDLVAIETKVTRELLQK